MLEEDDIKQEIPNPLVRKRPRVVAKTSIKHNAPQSCVDNGNTDLTVDTEPSAFIIYNNEVPELIESQVNGQNRLDTIVISLSTIMENQDKIMHQMGKLKIMLNETMLKLGEPTKSCAWSEQKGNLLDAAINPIDQVADLDALEEALNDKQVFQNYIDKMSFICGKSGIEKGMDVSYKLVDKFFRRKFMLQCSWAGGARDRKEKIAFKFYKNTIRLFFEIVHLADNRFTLAECETFFKNVLRNSVKRNKSLKVRASKSKRRPRKILYSEENQDATDEDEKTIFLLSEDSENYTNLFYKENEGATDEGENEEKPIFVLSEDSENITDIKNSKNTCLN